MEHWKVTKKHWNKITQIKPSARSEYEQADKHETDCFNHRETELIDNNELWKKNKTKKKQTNKKKPCLVVLLQGFC